MSHCSASDDGPTRRRLFEGAAVLAATPALGATRPEPPSAISGTAEVSLEINGRTRRLALDVRTSLLDALREHLQLTGSKKGCDQGQCGACTVLIDGKRALACLTLAVAAQGRRITTIEGVASGETLHPMQSAFIERDAFQCGYCTPSQILSAIACVEEGHARTDAEIREYMSGNLCRCAAYPRIVEAVKAGRDRMAAA